MEQRKSKTPIIDFVKEYQEKRGARFHMPGHKGQSFLGWEPYDITEISGADVLHLGDGIIAESERNASYLFGSGATHFSTEGSSHCIKAMLAILKMESGKERAFLLAGRNVHRSMVDACALLDLELQFLKEKEWGHLCTVDITPEDLRGQLETCGEMPLAVYVTSPDYLGQMLDIKGMANVCKEFQIPLVIDNAHGAYLHFWNQTHPMDFGAAMCCDSAHKTLPVVTGGAYLHIHSSFLERFEPYAAQAFCLFGSTSPSYLILQSLDFCNRYLSEQYEERLQNCIVRVEKLKEMWKQKGIAVKQSEPLKIVVQTGEHGVHGEEVAEELRSYGVECEYADVEYLVLMVTPENTEGDFEKLEQWGKKTMLRIRKKQKERIAGYQVGKWVRKAERVMGIREAALAKSEWIPVKQAAGRICAAETVSCPPAIPIAICGERISEDMVWEFLKYGIEKVRVVIGL